MPVTDEIAKEFFQVSFKTREGVETEGPLAYLWSLIETYEVDIFEVSLSRITDDFISYIHSGKVSLEEESTFALMASKLLNYKSKQLLPNPGFIDDSTPDLLPADLVDQLLEYKKFQIASEDLRFLEESSHKTYARESSWAYYEQGVEYLDVDLVEFLKIFQDFLLKMDKKQVMEVIAEEVNIETLMDEMHHYLLRQDGLSFFKWMENKSVTRYTVGFLAILEMCRLNYSHSFQEFMFKDILLKPTDNITNYKALE